MGGQDHTLSNLEIGGFFPDRSHLVDDSSQAAVTRAATSMTERMGGLEQRDQKEMTHRFPCQDACASNRWISFLLWLPVTAATYIRSSISEKVVFVFVASLQTAPEQRFQAEALLPLMQAARRASRARCHESSPENMSR
jgi:hypothetical protein